MLRSADARRSARRQDAPQIVLFTATRDWHARALSAALEKHGAAVKTMRLEGVAFDSRSPCGLRFGGGLELPDGALVRTVSAGTFEAVTRRLGVLHALSGLNVPVWNQATAIERCVDKSMTTFLLGQTGLPVPPSWTVEGREAALKLVEEHAAGGPLVLKPLFGSQGRGLALVRRPEDLPQADAVAGVYYLQRFVGGPGPQYRDFRIFVIGGEAVAAMARHGASWITNVKQGGRPMAIRLDRELGDLAGAAARTVGAAFCGVDIVRGPGGEPYILEVNSMPAWSGLQTVADIDIADLLASRFMREIAARPQRVAAAFA